LALHFPSFRDEVILAKQLGVKRSTVNRMVQKDQLLPPYAAESATRLLELDQMAMDVFATEEDAFKWLRQPHPMLEGDTPLDAAETSLGTARVKDILLSIKFGGVV
jgi:putative toxin-antitoxin system antitoxin component (TIGR02293 family)